MRRAANGALEVAGSSGDATAEEKRFPVDMTLEELQADLCEALAATHAQSGASSTPLPVPSLLCVRDEEDWERPLFAGRQSRARRYRIGRPFLIEVSRTRVERARALGQLFTCDDARVDLFLLTRGTSTATQR